MTSSLSPRLRDLRINAGLSQGQLAQKTGLSQVAIHRIENGDRNPSLKALSLISEALGVSIDTLMTGEPSAQDPRETELLSRFRVLSKREQDALIALVRGLAQ